MRRSLIAGLLACLALTSQLEPDEAFIGTWELTALSQAGRPRPGRGRLIVSPGPPGRPAAWTWDLAHQQEGDLVTTRRPGRPWPAIGRHTPARGAISYMDRGGDGVYRLAGDTLIVAMLSRRAATGPAEDPFRPAPGRTIETFRRVRREPDLSYRPTPFPKGPARLIAAWDEASRGRMQGPPRGLLNHYAAYDLGSGVRVIRRRRVEFLDDPPAPDLDPKDAPIGTIVRPPGGTFDDQTYDIAYPAPGPEARAVIDAFRTQDPDVPDRRWTYWGLFPKPVAPEYRFLGWDGILLTAEPDGDRTVAEVVFRPRVLGLSSHGTRCLMNYAPPLLETWELRGGRLRYLSGGPELDVPVAISSLLPAAGGPVATGPVQVPVRPRPAHLPPVDRTPVLPTLVHYRPDRIDLDDATRNFTEAGAPDTSGPEFTIHRAFSLVTSMPPPAERVAFFAEVLGTPGHHQARWDAVIQSAVPEGDAIRAEILVWPLVSVLEGGRFRTVPARPFRETWLYKDHRLRFVAGKPASRGGTGGRR